MTYVNFKSHKKGLHPSSDKYIFKKNHMGVPSAILGLNVPDIGASHLMSVNSYLLISEEIFPCHENNILRK